VRRIVGVVSWLARVETTRTHDGLPPSCTTARIVAGLAHELVVAQLRERLVAQRRSAGATGRMYQFEIWGRGTLPLSGTG
jgi:uncharacterized phage protein gp47/JayE